MAFDAVRFRELMTHFMPDLFRQGLDVNLSRQQAQLWLAKQIAENQDYMQGQMGLENLRYGNKLSEMGFGGNLAKEASYDAMRKRLLEVFTDPTNTGKGGSLPFETTAQNVADYLPDLVGPTGLRVPSGNRANINLAQSVGAKMADAQVQGTINQMDPATIATLIRKFGLKEVQDAIIEGQKQKTEVIKATTGAREAAVAEKKAPAEIENLMAGAAEKRASVKINPYYEKFIKPKTDEILKWASNLKSLGSAELAAMSPGMTPEILGKVLARVSALDSKAYKQELNASELRDIDNAWNLAAATSNPKYTGVGNEPGLADTDQYGFYLGQELNIVKGPNAGVWKYVGNNRWTRKQ